jgi:hypothetical protein
VRVDVRPLTGEFILPDRTIRTNSLPVGEFVRSDFPPAVLVPATVPFREITPEAGGVDPDVVELGTEAVELAERRTP